MDADAAVVMKKKRIQKTAEKADSGKAAG